MMLTKYKKINVVLLVTSIVVYAGAYLYWSEVCGGSTCSAYFIEGKLEPLLPASLVIGSFSTVFLFLPSHYFRGWLLWIFSWGFPLAFIITAATDPRSSSILSFSRAQVVLMLGVVFGVISVVYIAYHYWRSRQGQTVKTSQN